MVNISPMKLILTIKNEKELTIQLKEGNRVVDHEYLTIGQDFDSMLIATIDNMIVRNRIDRLSLEVEEIQGKIRAESVSGMILQSVISGLQI